MITLLYAAIIISLMIAPVVLLGYADKRHQRRTHKKLLQQFEQESAMHNLQISNQELLPLAVIGVDEQQRKLLVAWKEEEGFYRSRVFDLDGLKSCVVLEDQHADPDGSLFRADEQQIVDRIVLQLASFAWPATDIPFYDASQQSRRLLHPMRENAFKWKTLVARLVPATNTVRWTTPEAQAQRG